jgi:hypothetical protein
MFIPQLYNNPPKTNTNFVSLLYLQNSNKFANLYQFAKSTYRNKDEIKTNDPFSSRNVRGLINVIYKLAGSVFIKINADDLISEIKHNWYIFLYNYSRSRLPD